MNIKLELHKEGNFFLLDSQDIYNFIGESSETDLLLALYVDKWCENLNYQFLHNDQMAFDDGEKFYLDGWLTGFAMAKKIDIDYIHGSVKFKFGKYYVELPKPFEI